MEIDVLLICYNQHQFIQQAIESIFLQRIDANVRIIVADDASSDGTFEIIRNSIEKSPFDVIFLDREINLGISQNYFRAFDTCNGDYIAILEGDDYWCSPHHLQQHVFFLQEHRECSMSMNCFISKDEEAGVFRRMNWGYLQFPHYVNVQEQIEKGNKLGNLSACVLRTSCVKKLPRSLFDLSLADWMLGVMLSQQGFLAILEERTSVYRMNSRSKWASKSGEEQMQILLKRADEYDAFQNGIYHDYWRKFKSNLLQEKEASFKDYLPPFVVSLIEACTPPAIKKLIKNRGK